jgi:hypothetical protein
MGRRGAKFVLIAIGVGSLIAPASAAAAWTEPEPVPDSATVRPDYARLALFDNDDAVLTWTTDDRDGGFGAPVRAAIDPAGDGPMEVQTLGEAGTTCIGQLAANAAGDAAVVWRRPDGIVMVARRTPGQPFSEPEPLGMAWFPPEVAINARGDVAVFYAGWKDYESEYYVAFGRRGEPMTSPQAVAPGIDPGSSVSGYEAVIGPAGELAAAWPEWSTVDEAFAIRSAVVTSGLPGLFTTAGTAAHALTCPTAASNPAGDAVAVFHQAGCWEHGSVIVRRTAATPFGDARQLTSDAPGPDQIAVDDLGDAYISDGNSLTVVPKLGAPRSESLRAEGTALDVTGSGKGLLALGILGPDPSGYPVEHPGIVPIIDGSLRNDLMEELPGIRAEALSVTRDGDSAAALIALEDGSLGLARLTSWPGDPSDPGTDPDTDPPEVLITGHPRGSSYVVEARCDERCSLKGKGVLRRQGIRRRAGGEGQDRIRIRIKNLRLRGRAPGLIKVSVAAEDIAGNDTTTRRKLKVRG